MTIFRTTRYVGIAAGLCVAIWAAPLDAKQCYAPDARAQERAFSRAVITEGGKMIWLGGQTASLPPSPDFDKQVREVFASLDQTLKAQGGSLKDMVTMTVFINDARLGDRFVQLRKEILKECFPASALITVSGFAVPGLMIEVQGIAVIGGK
jgi:2-iminobutanoate/2-iminopropanoate deaminase